MCIYVCVCVHKYMSLSLCVNWISQRNEVDFILVISSFYNFLCNFKFSNFKLFFYYNHGIISTIRNNIVTQFCFWVTSFQIKLYKYKGVFFLPLVNKHYIFK